MDGLEHLRQIAESPGGDFTPLLVLGFALSTEGETQTVSVRTVADEVLLRTLLMLPTGRQWLHDALDRLCDATRSPDDQPRDALIKRVRVVPTDPPKNGTGFPR